MEGNVEMNQTVYNLKGKIVSIPAVDKTFLKEGYSADAKLTGEELNARVKKTDIVDNLTSADTDKPLSARQGKVLKDLVNDVTSSASGMIGYNNTDSGLSSTNVQGAIDEVANKTATLDKNVETMAQTVDALPDNYLSKNGGGMVKGTVKVQNAENGHGEVSKNNSATADYGTQLMDVRKDGKTSKITVSATTGLLSYTDVDNNIRNIHHEGNKPFVSYTGNGNAASRTVATKGIGRLAMVYGTTHISLVTPKGAIVVDLSVGDISWYDSTKMSYLNGNLLIGTTNEACNKANETYYIQAI